MIKRLFDGNDELARAALERAMSRQLAESFDQQITDQQAQVEALKAALKKLEMKLSEAKAKADLLIAQHRRSRAVNKAADAQLTPDGENRTFDRMRTKVAREEAKVYFFALARFKVNPLKSAQSDKRRTFETGNFR